MFEKLYKQLNKEQREAVDAIEGPVMVVAGPGTGKTQVLTLRIANILRKTDTEPENILALTFTEAAAVSMRQRLGEIIGSPAYGVTINTFHGFCNDIIKTYPEYFPRIMNSTNITEVDQINIIKNFVGYRLKDFLKKINDFKKDGISPKEIQKENPKIATIYANYEKELKKQKLYDYNDMILEVLRALKKNNPPVGGLLQILQERYQYVLADEHQDANKSQNKIIEILMSFHESPNVFVVGDEHQAIYRFQGASLENFLYFKNKYPEAKIIQLTKNYRSIQTILDAAHGILPSPKPLVATKKYPPRKISLWSFSKPEAEAYFVARDIKEKIKNGAKPHEIAVLYRNNKDAFLYSELMEKIKVPHQIESDIDILRDSDIRKIIILLHAVDDPMNDQKLISALHIDFFSAKGAMPAGRQGSASGGKNEPLEIYKLAAHAHKNKISAFEALREIMPKNYGIFSSWITLSRNFNFTDFFQKLIQESRFLANVMRKKDAVEKVNKLNSLFEEVKMLARAHKNYSLANFISYLEALEKHDVLIKRNPSLKLKTSVRLMTAHRSKGQEFERVYIAGAADGHWGGGFQQSDDDERRLFYVALTRAKTEITISYAKENELRKEQLKSRFVSEIGTDFLDEKDAKNRENEFERNKKILFTPQPSTKGNVLEKKFVKELFLERGLAVTALNNYLNCPWKYFYVNLLRIPQAQEKYQVFGTAVHEALKDFFTHKNETDTVKWKNLLMDRFLWHLKENSFSQNDFEELLLKGEETIPIFYQNRKNEWRNSIIPEKNITIAYTPEITLKGKIDKIEFLPNGTVKVTDFKTGKYKTRNEIEGKTKNSNGDMKRQLVFYNLLLNKYKNGKFKMSLGEVDFVQHDEKLRNRRELFYITAEEINELENLIKKTADEIMNLSFLNRHCPDPKCEYCLLRNMIEN